MNTRRSQNLLCLALIAIPVSNAQANDPCPLIEIANTLAQQAKTASDGGWKRADALAFTSAAFSWDPKASQPIYGQLADPQCVTVKVKGIASDDQITELNKPKAGDAADLFKLLATPPHQTETTLSTLWGQGADGQRKLALLFHSHSGAQNAVRLTVMRKLRIEWQNSKMTDGYAAFNTTMKTRAAIIDAIKKDSDLQKMERFMLYQSAQHVDRFYGNAIPDSLYDYLKPAT